MVSSIPVVRTHWDYRGRGRVVFAANPSNGLRIEVIAAYNLVVDSNVESPSTYAPHAAYLGAKFHNDGTNDLTGVTAYIGNYVNGAADTPGTYPTNYHSAYPTIVGPINGAFSLTHEGGSAGLSDAVRYLGTIKAGESVTVYWLVSYPSLDINGHAVWGPSVKPDDDLRLYYDVWGRGTRAGSPVLAETTRDVTMRNEISAMANKIFPNSANKVPQEYQDLLQKYAPVWTNIASGGSPGTLIKTEGVWYDLGNIGAGFDNDGNLVPDHNFWMQPVGDAALFNAGAFRLVRTHVLVVVSLKTGGNQVYVTDDQLYFQNVPENNGAVGYVAYEFMALGGGTSSTLTPYQEVASGFDNEKFNGDYGATVGGALVSAQPNVMIAKDASTYLVSQGSNIQYTITFTNAGALAIGNPGLGLPMTIQDRIPTGTVYVAGSATNNVVLPAGVSGYTMLFSTNNMGTWLTSEPAPASAVTHIQWWLGDVFPTGTSGRVSFSVTVANPYTNGPVINNVGGLGIGSGVPFLTDDANSMVTGTNRLGDTVFLDEGAGLSFANGVQNAGEAGISNITVNLYYDVNTNGVRDAGDLFLLSAVTGTNGVYGFTNLVAGRYVAEVDINDPDLPVGYTISTPGAYGALLGPGGTNSYLSADFGFVPALTMTKSLLGTNILYEGRTVSYALDVRNVLPGNGTEGGGNRVYTTYGKTLKSNGTGWLSPSNAATPNAVTPDGLLATNLFESNPTDLIEVRDFTGNLLPGSSNVNVKIVVPWGIQYHLGAKDSFWVLLTTGSGVVVTQSPELFLTNQVTGEFTMDITAATNNWSFLSDTNTSIGVNVKKDGGISADWMLIDAMGLRITSTQQVGGGAAATTLKPVPLFDTFDTNRLQFVSASTPPASITYAGSTGTLYWADLGPLYPGGSNRVTLTYNVLQPPGNVAAPATNAAAVTNAFYLNGRAANTATGLVVATVRPTGTIGDFVWRDMDGDGVQDGGNETGISGVSVALTPPADADAGSGIGVPVTNVTDATGKYLFTGIYGTNSGSYVITVLTNTLPGASPKNTYDLDNGTNSPNSAVTTNFNPAATNGADVLLTVDFGYQVQSRILGTIWNDVNRNGTNYAESGEGWLTNVTVYLYSTNNLSTPVATNRTTIDGYFSFTGNYTGGYVVVVATNTGSMSNSTWVQTYDTDAATRGLSNSVTVSVVGGGAARADFSYYNLGTYSIGDQLYHDWNSNGVFEAASEEGIKLITVSLYEDANSNGVVDAGVDALVAVTQTDINGVYLFTGLPPGPYQVIVDQSDPQMPPSYFVTGDPDAAKDGRSVVSISSASNTNQDFGYWPYGFGAIGDRVWLDANADGLQGGAEVGISNITVNLYVDMNGDGVFVLRASTTTDAAGAYLFSSLPVGTYRVAVDTTDADLPKDAFGYRVMPTTVTNFAVAVTNGNPILSADFGFAKLAAVGDTIFWDLNANGTQDGNEDGITNVTVKLYQDVNQNGVADAGDSNVATTVTSTNGLYLFAGLAAGRYVVLVDTNSAILANTMLTADPNNDGLPYGDPLATNYDHMVGCLLQPGSSFMGADFGYRPPGVIGDTVWFDVNTNGVRDAGELGIPYVTVGIYTNGTLMATNDTDDLGYYSFGNLRDGAYTVKVFTNDVDFPAGVTNVYDPDGVNDDTATSIVISNGFVVTVSGQTWTNGSLGIDFGYRYAGNNSLGGTIGMDALPYDGVLGTGNSGVGSGEQAFQGVTVYAYVWKDLNSNGVVEAQEQTFIKSTTTDTNGDYLLTGLPTAVGPAGNWYLISTAPPMGIDVLLTTSTATNGSPSVVRVVNTTNDVGLTIAAYQVVAINPVTVNIDFAFSPVGTFDYGDLPGSYGTKLADLTAGARHVVRPVPDLYLGAAVDVEGDGQPTIDAIGDDTNGVPNDEDGVVPVGIWQTGSSGGVVRVTVGAGSGWLCGFMDFNHNGDFADSNELFISRAVTTGTYSLAFTVPGGAITTTNATWLYARFRLFSSEPLIPPVAYAGSASDGEVEDYRFTFATVGDFVWVDSNGNGVREAGEPPLTNVTVFADLNTNGVWNPGEPYTVTDTNGFHGIGGLTGGIYTIVVNTSSLPAGLVASYDATGPANGQAVVAVAAGGYATNMDFGYVVPSTISGVVALDINGNGTKDAADTNGISGVTVILYATNGVGVATNTTDAGGGFAFTNVFPGSYTIVEVDAAGYASTGDSDNNATTNVIGVTVTSGSTSIGHYFLDTLASPPAVFLIKLAGDTAEGSTRYITSGASVVYSYMVSNAGACYLSGVAVTDNVLGVVGSVTLLGPGMATNLYVTTAVFADVTNVAVAAGTPSDAGGAPIGYPVVRATNDAVVDVVNPALGIVKTADNAYALPGQLVTYTFAVTNSGDVTLTNVTVSDVTFGLNWTVGPLAAGETTNLTWSTNLVADTTNVAKVVGWPGAPGIDPVTNTDDAAVDVVHPGMRLIKTAGSAADGDVFYVPASNNVVYTYCVINTGDTYLTNVTVADDVIGSIGAVTGVVAPGATNWLYATNFVTTNYVINVGTVVGQPCFGNGSSIPNVGSVSNQDNAIVDVEGRGLRLIKRAGNAGDSQTEYVLPGESVVYSYEIINVGDAVLTNVTVLDDKLGQVGVVPGFVMPGETNYLYATSSIAESVTNYAEAWGTPTNGLWQLLDTHRAYVEVVDPKLELIKTAGNTPEGQVRYVLPGTAVTYTYAVSNAGGSYLSSVTVTDNVLGAVGTIALLAPGAATNLSFTTSISASVTNVAEVTGDPSFANGTPIPDLGNAAATNDAVVRVVSPGFTVQKTLVSPTNRPAIPGEALTFRLKVSNTGDVTLATVPVTDSFNTSDLAFAWASPSPDQTNASSLVWTNAGPLAPGGSTNLMVTFTAAGYTMPGLGTNVVLAAPTTPPDYPPVSPAMDAATYSVGQPATIGDFVWMDANVNGIQEAGEPGVSNVNVKLYDASLTVVAGASTDANGFYQFTNVPSGSYTVEFVPPAGYAFTLPYLGGNPALDSDADPVTGRSAPVVAAVGSVVLTVDAGLYRHGTYALIGSFRGELAGSTAMVIWDTRGEMGTAGFELWRRGDGTAAWALAAGFLPAAGSAPLGAEYRFADPGVQPGQKAMYRLVEIDSQGRRFERGVWEVVFPGLSSQTIAAAAAVEPYSFVERAVSAPAKQAGVMAVAQPVSGSASTGAPPAAIKVYTDKAGLTGVSVADLAGAFDRTEQDVRQALLAGGIALANIGRSVAAQYGTNGIQFIAEAMDTRFTGRNVYWMRFAPGRAMAEQLAPQAQPVAGLDFETELKIEQNRVLRTDLFDNPEEDMWLWRAIYAGYSSLMRTFNATFDAPRACSATGRIAVRLKGAVSGRSHPATVFLNGTALGSVTVQGLEAVTSVFECANLRAAGNTLTVTADGPPGGVVLVDCFTVRYRRDYQAVQDEIVFDAAGHPALTVSGFSGPDISLYDISDPASPVCLRGLVPVGTGGGYAVSFAPAGATNRYLAVCGRVNQPVRVAPALPACLRGVGNGADYVVITVDSLMAAGQGFVDYRASRGLSGMAVSAEAIYDEFNCGIADPRAIRAFLGYAYRMWAKSPRYVLLAGRGTVDYRDYLGYGDCMVPGLLAATGHGLHVSDALLADFDGNGIPEMAVGRLPVGTLEEAFNGLAKTRAYEQGGSWKQRALMLADNPDKGGDFPADCDGTALGLAGLDVGRAYLGTQSVVQVRAQLFAALAEGRGLLCYYGHGALSQVAEEGILAAADATAIGDGAKPPLVMAMTCMMGSLGTPGASSLGAALVASSSGAAAVLGSGTLVYNDEGRRMADAVVSNLYGKGVARMGDALLAAGEMVAGAGLGNLVRSYNLMGDPALAVGDADSVRPGPDVPAGTAGFDEWLQWAFPPAILIRGVGAGSSDDPDADGQANAAEWITGTDPLSAADVLRIIGILHRDGQVMLRWRSAPRRSYILERASRPEGPYEPVGGQVPATPSMNESSAGSTDEASRFYRVRVSQ